jgi:stearoyl-CoA desaturase (delta-9 desaturase)
MFAITGFYHRYFSHRTFRTSRFMQFLFALLGATSMQRGALWWAAHHRQHHRYSDGQKDVHSPIRQGFWWSHCLWFTCEAHFPTDYAKVKDLAKFPELRWLNRFDSAIPFLLLPILWGMGSFIEVQWPESQTNGWQFLVWVYFISTTLLAHATFSINSLAHRWGSRPFKTNDQSRNNAFLALLTLGEGWHNNHHRFPSSCRQGLHWWQWDPTYWGLRSLASLGLIWNIQQSPPTTGMPGKKESRT